MEKINTEIIQSPDVSVELLYFKEKIDSLLKYANGLEITEDAILKGANDDITMIRALEKEIEERRIEFTKPLLDKKKSIDNTFKLITEPLFQADKIVEGKIIAYRQEQERKRLEIERINALKQEAIKSEMALKGELSPDTDTKMLEVPETHGKLIRSQVGTTGTQKTWQFEVEDIDKVPREYLKIDEVKIKGAIRAGVKIPGIKAWQEESLRVIGKK